MNPDAPYKTTNCTGSLLTFAVLPEKKEVLISFMKEFMESRSVSPETGICYLDGLIMTESPYKNQIKTEIRTAEYANAEAERLGIRFIDSANGNGRVGALGALLWANNGVEAAGLFGEEA